VTVRLKRQPGFAGEVRLELVPPGGTQGVSATPINLPAGANEAGLVVKAEKGARPGPPAEYVVRATAKAGTATLKSEARVAVRVGDGPAGPGRKEQEVLAAGSAGWRYAAKVEGNGWVAPDFDDKAWREARTPLGNGEPEVTARKGTEVAEKGQDLFCRRAFDVPAELLKRPGAEFRLRVASDNSATVYLNGKPADDEDTDHEFAYWNREVVLPAALLKPGRNVVAVRVRNSAGSSDAYLDLAIVASFPAAAPGK
jgi:hypothetical protein